MSYWPEEQKTERRKERRTGPDKMSQWLRFSSFLSWLFLCMVIIISDAARPSQFNIYVLDEKFGKNTTTYVRPNFYEIAAGICIFTFLFTLTNLLIDSRRKRRKTDRYSISLLLAMIGSFIGLIFFAVYFLV